MIKKGVLHRSYLNTALIPKNTFQDYSNGAGVEGGEGKETPNPQTNNNNKTHKRQNTKVTSWDFINKKT